VIPAAVRYERATDVEHALELLQEPDAKALAGGQSLLPVMKLRIARPALLVDVSRLPLRGVTVAGDVLRIGPLTTWSELASAPELARPAVAAIRDCACRIGDLQVGNLGTIGGSLAHADPASDMPAVLLALGATVAIRWAEGERSLALDALLLGPFTTALEPSELLVEIAVPLPASGSGSAYASVEHPASGFALAGAAALADPGGETVALTGIAGRPFLVAGDLANVEVFGDRFAPADYRRALAGVVVGRALEAARIRAGEDAP